MKSSRKLFPQRTTLTVEGRHLSPHEPALLISAASDEVVDANCAMRSFAIVPKTKATESWRTGVKWFFELREKGVWRIRNQGQDTHILTGNNGTVQLSDKTVERTILGTDWIIYKHEESGSFAMRSDSGHWLTLQNGELSMAMLPDDISETFLWKLQRPAPLPQEPQNATRPLAQRARSALGRIKRKLI